MLTELKFLLGLCHFADELGVLIALEPQFCLLKEIDSLVEIYIALYLMSNLTLELSRSIDGDEGVLERVDSGLGVLDKCVVQFNEICTIIEGLVSRILEEDIGQLMPESAL